jgi:hypothetical protein
MQRKLLFLLTLNLSLLGLTLSSVNFHLVITPIQPVIAPTIPGRGDINGSVYNDLTGDGTYDTGELPIEDIQLCIYSSITINTTGAACVLTGESISSANAEGNYTFRDLLPGEYSVTRISATDFGGMSLVGTTPRSHLVTVEAGKTTWIDFGVQVLAQMPPEVTVESVGTDLWTGLPQISRTTASSYTKDVTDHCYGNPYGEEPVIGGVKLTLEFIDSGVIIEEMMTNIGGEIWEAIVEPVTSGVAVMTFYVDCLPDTPNFPENIGQISGEDEIQEGGGVIYIDPSGTILDACNDLPLEGATATLLILSEGVFIPVPEFVSPAIMLPNENTLITGADGRYHWDVIAGTYKVRAEKAGYVTAESDALIIPPPVTGLDFYLERTGGCPTVKDQLESFILDIEDLIENVEHLIETEELTNHQGKFLDAKLDAVRDSLTNENINSAITQLEGFIKRVDRFVEKEVLLFDQGQSLIDKANEIINELGSFNGILQ